MHKSSLLRRLLLEQRIFAGYERTVLKKARIIAQAKEKKQDLKIFSFLRRTSACPQDFPPDQVHFKPKWKSKQDQHYGSGTSFKQRRIPRIKLRTGLPRTPKNTEFYESDESNLGKLRFSGTIEQSSHTKLEGIPRTIKELTYYRFKGKKLGVHPWIRQSNIQYPSQETTFTKNQSRGVYIRKH